MLQLSHQHSCSICQFNDVIPTSQRKPQPASEAPTSRPHDSKRVRPIPFGSNDSNGHKTSHHSDGMNFNSNEQMFHNYAAATATKLHGRMILDLGVGGWRQLLTKEK